MKQKVLNFAVILVAVLIVIFVVWGISHKKEKTQKQEMTSEELANIEELEFADAPKVKAKFSDVILGPKQEVRKLVVLERAATVETELTKKMIEILDIPAFEKSQKVSYTGLGRYLVNLDDLEESSVVDDEENKILTIKIGHAYLESVEIDPYKIKADEVEEGFFARGNIKLSVEDYNTIEKTIKSKMEEKLKTAQLGQEADEVALKMVKEIYEPVIKAIDEEYEVRIEFK